MNVLGRKEEEDQRVDLKGIDFVARSRGVCMCKETQHIFVRGKSIGTGVFKQYLNKSLHGNNLGFLPVHVLAPIQVHGSRARRYSEKLYFETSVSMQTRQASTFCPIRVCSAITHFLQDDPEWLTGR